MDNNKRHLVTTVLLLLILLGIVVLIIQQGAVASAQERAIVEPATATGVTPLLLQYQGRLSSPDSGDPVEDGSYTMTLRLYKQASGGKAQWTETKDIPLQDGLFSTVLGDTAPLNQALFNGQALWLGVKVGADAEALPRQQILPVAYALGLLPGTAVQANSSKSALTLSNNGSGSALNADGPVVVDGSLTVNGALKGSHANNVSAHHKRYTDSEAASAALSHPEIVTQYEFEDHIYGGMHNGRAIAYGSINQHGEVSSATGNVSSRWVNLGEYYEITIDGHTYDQRYYVTTVTPIFGFATAWAIDGKLCVGIYHPDGQALKRDFHFVTFKP